MAALSAEMFAACGLAAASSLWACLLTGWRVIRLFLLETCILLEDLWTSGDCCAMSCSAVLLLVVFFTHVGAECSAVCLSDPFL